jgi:hypothetical protein
VLLLLFLFHLLLVLGFINVKLQKKFAKENAPPHQNLLNVLMVRCFFRTKKLLQRHVRYKLMLLALPRVLGQLIVDVDFNQRAGQREEVFVDCTQSLQIRVELLMDLLLNINVFTLHHKEHVFGTLIVFKLLLAQECVITLLCQQSVRTELKFLVPAISLHSVLLVQMVLVNGKQIACQMNALINVTIQNLKLVHQI